MVCCILLTGCGRTEKEVLPDSKEELPYCSEPVYTVYDCYSSYGGDSFVKFKLDNVRDGVYLRDRYSQYKYLLLEVTVIFKSLLERLI